MRMVNTKEKLEKELHFLKESYDAGVISREEYNRNKDRIDKKLFEIEEVSELDQLNPSKESEEVGEYNDEDFDDSNDDSYLNRKKEEDNLENEKNDDTDQFSDDIEDKDEMEAESKSDLDEEPIKDDSEEIEDDVEDITSEEEKVVVDENKTSSSKIVIWILLAIILIGAIIFTLRDDSQTSENNALNDMENKVDQLCKTDNDCIKTGKVGICNRPGDKEAKCEYLDIIQTKLTVLNDDSCDLCDANRIITLLKKLFPGTENVTVDIKSDEGKRLLNDLGIDMIPSYIYDENFSQTANFQKMSRAFEKKDGKFLMSNDAAGANLYLKRKEIMKRIDVFYDQGSNSSELIKKNLGIVKGNLQTQVTIEYHNIKEDSLAKELEIKTTPLLLMNNKIRFYGIRSAQSIQELFCQMNKDVNC